MSRPRGRPSTISKLDRISRWQLDMTLLEAIIYNKLPPINPRPSKLSISRLFGIKRAALSYYWDHADSQDRSPGCVYFSHRPTDPHLQRCKYLFIQTHYQIYTWWQALCRTMETGGGHHELNEWWIYYQDYPLRFLRRLTDHLSTLDAGYWLLHIWLGGLWRQWELIATASGQLTDQELCYVNESTRDFEEFIISLPEDMINRIRKYLPLYLFPELWMTTDE